MPTAKISLFQPFRINGLALHTYENEGKGSFIGYRSPISHPSAKGGGHYDQSTPILGKLYRKVGRVEELEPESDCTDTEIESEVEEIAELALPTFATLEDESEVPILERGDSDEEESDTSEEEGVDGSMSKSYDNLKNEAEVDAALKAAIQRGDSEKKIDALLEQYEPPKPTPEGIAL